MKMELQLFCKKCCTSFSDVTKFGNAGLPMVGSTEQARSQKSAMGAVLRVQGPQATLARIFDLGVQTTNHMQ